MAKSSNQKLKLLYIYDKLMRDSNEENPVSTNALIEMLNGLGISAERKSIYDDIEALRDFGMDIRFRRGKPGGYYLAGNR